jgi:hypothetical protein
MVQRQIAAPLRNPKGKRAPALSQLAGIGPFVQARFARQGPAHAHHPDQVHVGPEKLEDARRLANSWLLRASSSQSSTARSVTPLAARAKALAFSQSNRARSCRARISGRNEFQQKKSANARTGSVRQRPASIQLKNTRSMNQ